MPGSDTQSPFRPQVAILTGGGDRPYALGLAMSLVQRGIHFDFIGSDFLESAELRHCPQVRFLNLRGDMRPEVPAWQKVIRVAKYYARLIGYAATARPRIFHILWNNKIESFDRTLLTLYYRALGKRAVLTVHNVNIRKRDGNDSLWNRLTLSVQYRLVDHLFVHTAQMRRELSQDFKVPAAKISVIPFGVNNTVPNTGLKRDEARRRCGLGSSDRVLLFYGNIAPYKGLTFLIEAFARVAESDPDMRLIVAGRPKGSEAYWARIEQMIAELALSEKLVLRIEYIPDADTEVYFKAADVLCLPYTHVFQSGVLFLGYNFGIPVIASDVGSLRDDIIEGKTGLVCRPGDADDLARAIAQFFGGRTLGGDIFGREEIRKFAEERYSWATVAEITQGIYAALLKMGGPAQHAPPSAGGAHDR